MRGFPLAPEVYSVDRRTYVVADIRPRRWLVVVDDVHMATMFTREAARAVIRERKDEDR